MGRALARLQDESCLQQKQGIHLGKENQGSEATESWESSKQQINNHSGTGALQKTGSYLGFVQMPERIENPVEVTGVFLDMLNVPVPLPAQLLLGKHLWVTKTPTNTVTAKCPCNPCGTGPASMRSGKSGRKY